MYPQHLIQKYGIRANKSLGQNFLINGKVIMAICSLFSKEDTVLEIGPGLGSITIPLTERVNHVTAVEFDKQLVAILQTEYASVPNLEIIPEDILLYTPPFSTFSYKVFGALPYNLSKQIVRKFITMQNIPATCYFVLQKEVAEDYLYKKPFSYRSLSTSLFAHTKILLAIEPSSFKPQPKVRSMLIQMTPKELTQTQRDENESLSRFIKSCFISPRKQLVNTLQPLFHKEKHEVLDMLKKVSLSPTSRAEELEIETWKKLKNLLKP